MHFYFACYSHIPVSSFKVKFLQVCLTVFLYFERRNGVRFFHVSVDFTVWLPDKQPKLSQQINEPSVSVKSL